MTRKPDQPKMVSSSPNMGYVKAGEIENLGSILESDELEGLIKRILIAVFALVVPSERVSLRLSLR